MSNHLSDGGDMAEQRCKECDQPMLPKGWERLTEDEYRHAKGCPNDDWPFTPAADPTVKQSLTVTIVGGWHDCEVAREIGKPSSCCAAADPVREEGWKVGDQAWCRYRDNDQTQFDGPVTVVGGAVFSDDPLQHKVRDAEGRIHYVSPSELSPAPAQQQTRCRFPECNCRHEERFHYDVYAHATDRFAAFTACELCNTMRGPEEYSPDYDASVDHGSRPQQQTQGEKCRACGKARGGICGACHCSEVQR